jgi:hypothetical protein
MEAQNSLKRVSYRGCVTLFRTWQSHAVRFSFRTMVMKSPGLKPIEAQNARSSSASVPYPASMRQKQTSNIAGFVKRKTLPEGGELADASNCDLPHGTSRNADLACSIRRCGLHLVPSSHDRRQDMESEKIEVRPLTEHELDVISGGLDCDITPSRMEASMKVGGATLVIWATAGCSGTYWK